VAFSVHIHIVGLNRSLSTTEASIVSRVIRPLSTTPGVRAQTNIVLIRPEGAISNPLSGESGFVETDVPESLATWPVTYLEQKDLAATAKAPAKRLLALGDVYGDGGKSIEWALIYMRALAHSSRMMKETPDVAIVLRPDVKIAGRLWIRWRVLLLAIKARAQRPELKAPAWGNFGGVNDRFAVMSGQLAERYLGRVENVGAWVSLGNPFDPEKFLALSLEGSKIKRSIYTPMFRIRIGGRLENADLSFFETPAVVARLRDSFLKTAQTLRSWSSRMP
jgi:hypothetical protein